MSFTLAHLEGGGMPPVIERPLDAGEAFEEGALLFVNSDGEYEECSADPTVVAAVAMTPCGTDASGFNRLGTKEFPPGYMQGILVRDQTFHARYTGSLPAAAGGLYGVVRDTDSLWKVDFGDTTHDVVELVSIDWTVSPISRNRVLVRFIEGVIQNNES